MPSNRKKETWIQMMDRPVNRRQVERVSQGTQVTIKDLETVIEAEPLNPASTYACWLQKKVEKTAKHYPQLLVRAVIPPTAAKTSDQDSEDEFQQNGEDAIKLRRGYCGGSKGTEPKKPEYI